MGHEFGSGLPGWFWPGVPNELIGKMLVGAIVTSGVTWAGGFTSKIAPEKLMPQFFVTWPSSNDFLHVFTVRHQASFITSDPREQGGSLNNFYDIVSEVTHHTFAIMIDPTDHSSYNVRRDRSGVWLSGSKLFDLGVVAQCCLTSVSSALKWE